MRAVAIPSRGGAAYQIYRGSGDFHAELTCLARFARESGCRVGEAADDPDAALTIGPLDPKTDAAFRKKFSIDAPPAETARPSIANT